jgi:FAD/FMN-containing dehydrogenase/Fe-S oxidoreductase
VDAPSSDRIRDDLKGVLKGELLFDDLSRTFYSTDASPFALRPLGIALPRDSDDVAALVRYAGEHGIPLVPRGAGSGVAGEALGAGLIVDLSKYFRTILEVGADSVRVQPGVVQRELAAALAREGRRFAPDPAHGDCTLGGMLATNASGARAFRHGTTRDHVVSLGVVLDSGDRATVGRQPRWPTPSESRPQGRLEDIVSSLGTLLSQNAELIASQPLRTPFDRCGYGVRGVLGPDALDLARLLVGSEGTLALFTEATLRTIPLAGGRAAALLGFGSLDAALRAALLSLPTGPAACELLDRRLLRLSRGAEPGVDALVPAAAEAALLVEYEADTPEEARATAADLAAMLQRGERLALLAVVAADEAEVQRLWQVREAALPGLYTLRGAEHPIPFVEDVGVPPERLAEYLHKVQEVLRRHETTASFLIHAATGQVHMRPFLDPGREGEPGRMWALADETYTLALELGGTITAQHGTGLARTPWVSRQLGPLYPLQREVKAVFDPRHLFNPGKIVSPGPVAWPLRSPLREPPATEHSLALAWRPGEMNGEVAACNGCGSCRSVSTAQRMCPIFRATHDEAATPRAKANLVRHLLQPDADPRLWSTRAVREVADLCVNCKMCAVECPARVNIPKLMLEAKAAYVAEQGLDRADWVLARLESFARLGSAVAPLANALIGSRVARWLMERLFGLSRHRRLPPFAWRSFLRRARRRGWTRKPRSAKPRVAYFVDIFANYIDPSIAEAAVAVLHRNGVEVYVPPGQAGCGMAPLALGDVDTARETVEHNLHVLADLAREGYPIVCSEPTAAVMLRHDALDLLDDADARLVAGQTVELTDFLRGLHREGRLRTDFGRLELEVGHHVPCHLKALGGTPAGPGLLSLIPGLRVRTIDVSCSGMAGTFGLRASARETSLAAGRPMLEELGRAGVLAGSTECSACRLQMEDAGGKRTLHPVQYLALAYGDLPELGERLRRPLGDLVL